MGFDTEEAGAVTGSWEDVVGRRFVEALNEGLVREAARRHRAARPSRGPARVPDLFEARVVASFDAALQTALAPEERDDIILGAALRLRARQVLTRAASAAAQSEEVPQLPAAGPLSPEHDMLVVTLLMECAMLAALDGPAAPAAADRTAGLVRALGRSARTSRTPARST
ncbi:hypothetical protein I2W78_35105 [Streptomyces spinoverrucosus]|nr:hypothetical protein [Streptomyces spinoverrucosus]